MRNQPASALSDNGPEFHRAEFRHFCRFFSWVVLQISFPIVFRRFDIRFLGRFIPASQKENHPAPLLAEINPVARSKKEPQFVHSAIQRFEVAKLPPFESANPAEDALPRFLIKRSNPIHIWACP